MPSDPLVRRAIVACGGVALFGVAVFFGWTMVRFPRFRGAEPAPIWLPWLAAGLTIGPLAVILVLRSVTGASRGDESPVATSGAPDTSDAPDAPDALAGLGPVAVASVVIGVFTAGLAVPAIAATDSAARWDPVVLAALVPVAALVLRWWTRRRR